MPAAMPPTRMPRGVSPNPRASSCALATIDDALGLKWAWLAKPLVELALGALGFFMSRHWVYRK